MIGQSASVIFPQILGPSAATETTDFAAIVFVGAIGASNERIARLISDIWFWRVH